MARSLHDSKVIVPADLFLQNNTVFSKQFNDIYWSSEGGLAETRHVFLGGNQLPCRWQTQSSFVILETGFGTGLNFLTTWQHWRETAPTDARLHYIALEKHPFRRDDLSKLYALWPQIEPLGTAFLAHYPALLPGFHRLHFEDDRISLTLLWGEASTTLPQLNAQVDAFFLDGFAPDKNPEMWSEALFRQLARLAAPKATLATFTVAGTVRRGLAGVGFDVEKKQGFGKKREMLVASFNPHHPHHSSLSSLAKSDGNKKQAIVIGAGLAGTHCAERLAARGWKVDLIERGDTPACETSGNPAGLILPMLSLDWNPISRFTTAAYHYTLRELARLTAEGYPLVWQNCGILQLARNEVHADKQKRIIECLGLPEAFVRCVTVKEGSALCGMPTTASGCWFPEGCWANPASLCEALLTRAGSSVRLHRRHQIISLYQSEGLWHVIAQYADDPPETPHNIAQAPTVIFANALEANTLYSPLFPDRPSLPLRPIRGQISYLPLQDNLAGASLLAAVCREGLITPALPSGIHIVGASYEDGSLDKAIRVSDHKANLSRLEDMLPGYAQGIDPETLTGRAATRCVSPDRLPLIGELAPGLYACLGFASRGLTWTSLSAELLACMLNGEPLPLEMNLVKGVNPARF